MPTRILELHFSRNGAVVVAFIEVADNPLSVAWVILALTSVCPLVGYYLDCTESESLAYWHAFAIEVVGYLVASGKLSRMFLLAPHDVTFYPPSESEVRGETFRGM